MKGIKNLSESNVAIVGLGLMGGSLAMALRGRCKHLFGCDLAPATLELARGKNMFDTTDADIKAVLPGADLVVLATPVGTILDLICMLPEFLQGPAVILDLGSTKADIVAAMEGLPRELEPIGGHPMCGKEASGLENADGHLFHGATFALCAPKRTTQGTRALVEELVLAIGAMPLWMEPEIHDEWVVATSHLPYLLSLTLVDATPLEAAPMIGPGFLSSTRLAASNPEMMRDVILTNQGQVLAAIKRFQTRLENLEALINIGDADKIWTHFEDSRRRRQRIIKDREEV